MAVVLPSPMAHGHCDRFVGSLPPNADQSRIKGPQSEPNTIYEFVSGSSRLESNSVKKNLISDESNCNSQSHLVDSTKSKSDDRFPPTNDVADALLAQIMENEKITRRWESASRSELVDSASSKSSDQSQTSTDTAISLLAIVMRNEYPNPVNKKKRRRSMNSDEDYVRETMADIRECLEGEEYQPPPAKRLRKDEDDPPLTRRQRYEEVQRLWHTLPRHHFFTHGVPNSAEAQKTVSPLEATNMHIHRPASVPASKNVGEEMNHALDQEVGAQIFNDIQMTIPSGGKDPFGFANRA